MSDRKESLKKTLGISEYPWSSDDDETVPQAVPGLQARPQNEPDMGRTNHADAPGTSGQQTTMASTQTPRRDQSQNYWSISLNNPRTTSSVITVNRRRKGSPRRISLDPNNTGGLVSQLQLGVGTRVMLRMNIKVSEGLVNGSMGVVRGFEWEGLRRDQLEDGELPKKVLVQFDDRSIGRSRQDINGWVDIAPASVSFQGNKGFGKIERVMLPLILSWAVTVHKLQGTTVDKAVIYLGPKTFAKGQAYVALSRVRSLDGVVITDLDQRKLFNNPHNSIALEELERLRSTLRRSQSDDKIEESS